MKSTDQEKLMANKILMTYQYNMYYIMLSLCSVGYGDEISMPNFEVNINSDMTTQIYVMILGTCMFAYFSSRTRIVLDKLLHEQQMTPEVKEDYFMDQIDRFCIDFNKNKSNSIQIDFKNRIKWKKFNQIKF